MQNTLEKYLINKRKFDSIMPDPQSPDEASIIFKDKRTKLSTTESIKEEVRTELVKIPILTHTKSSTHSTAKIPTSNSGNGIEFISRLIQISCPNLRNFWP